MSSEKLVWEDTDKKGRPRQRDCRPVLGSLELVGPVAEESQEGIAIECQAQIDSQGRSIKPAQLKHWFSEALAQPLHLQNVRRLELRLVRC